MANKLKDIFSNNTVDMGGKVHFDSPEAQENFLQALETVWEEGKSVEVKGITSVSMNMKDGNYSYPVSQSDKIDKFFVTPSIEPVPIVLKTEMGEKVLQLRRFYTNNDIIVETDPKAIIYIKMSVKKGTDQNTFFYRVQPQFANSIADIIESHVTVISFMDYLFNDDVSGSQSEIELISKTKDYFVNALDFYKRMHKVEEELDLKFCPATRNEKNNDEQEFEELYSLLFENKAFRVNAKLTSSGGFEVKNKSVTSNTIGTKLALTFTGTAEFNIYGQTILIYTANLLSNAIVTDMKEENGSTKIWYDDTDSEPMFVSYTGFKSEAERDHEVDIILDAPKKYTEAITVDEYLKQKYSIK